MIANMLPAQLPVSLDKDDPELRAVLNEIEADIEKARVKEQIPGISVVIVYDQDVLLAKGFGYADLEKKIPADPQTIYRVGSVTKVFTALMLMQLRDAGKLQLDDPIEKYLPEFKIKSRFPDARPVTFRQVASHYSGLPTEPPMPHQYQLTGKFPSVEEQLKSLKDAEMLVPAMTEYSYSNLGYNIMGLAMSRIAKQPYDLYVMGRILKPLGMNHSGFALNEQMKSHYAVGYDAARPDGTYPRSAYIEHGLASGMLYSTVDDLAELLSLFFREGPAGGKQVLGSSSLREMLLPVKVSDDIRRTPQGKPASLWDTGSTIGFSVDPTDGEEIHYKPGGTNGYSAMVYINHPRKLGMAVLMNTHADPFFETFDPLGFGVLKKLTPVVARVLDRRRNQALTEVQPSWQEHTGRYVITDPNAVRTLTFSEFDVSIVRQRLIVTIPDSLPGSFVYMKEAHLVAFEGNVFHVSMDDGGSFKGNFMTFESNQDGSIVLKWRNYVFKRQT